VYFIAEFYSITVIFPLSLHHTYKRFSLCNFIISLYLCLFYFIIFIVHSWHILL